MPSLASSGGTSRAALILDLDGTLVDSLPGIELSLRAALDRTAPEWMLPDLRSHIGPPLDRIVRALFPEMSPNTRAAVLDAFREHYDAIGYRASIPYPGVDDSLARLCERGHPVYLLTNKRSGPTRMILECLGWAAYFAEVATSGPGGSERKPEVGLAMVQRLGLARAGTLLVGDTAEDLHAAAACGLTFVHARYGYGPPMPSELAIDRFADVELLVGRQR